jgi:DnaJ-class molecular chaperone
MSRGPSQRDHPDRQPNRDQREKPKICGSCDGEGTYTRTKKETCPSCNGQGCPEPKDKKDKKDKKQKKQKCKNGKIEIKIIEKCTSCNGKGIIR